MNLRKKGKNFFKIVLISCLVFVIALIWVYIAGGIFLLAFNRNINETTPLTLYQYWYYYGAEKQVQKWIFIASFSSVLAIVIPFVFFLMPAKRSLFGDARFAKKHEIKRAGLLGEKGIIVGKKYNKYLMFKGSQHAIISAPTRSGKGVGVVIPNLLSWPESLVVLDIKQENWDITSGYRAKHGQECYLFNPAAVDYRTHRYNPLSYISDNPSFRIDDVQKIANMLFPDQPGTDVIWTASPRSFFLGVVLYLLETPQKLVTLGQVLRESLAEGDSSLYFTKIINMRILGEHIKNTKHKEAEDQAELDFNEVMGDKGKAHENHPRLSEMAVWYHLNSNYKKAFDHKCTRENPLNRKLEKIKFDRQSAEIGKALSPACVRALSSFISISSENTRAGIITSFRSRLELWMNPLVDAATSANDFDLRQVRKKQISIYLGVTPDNLERMAPLLNLFFQQLLDLNTRELPNQNKDIKYTCLLLMDEFTSIGKISILSKGISYIAGYGLRMMPIIQSPAQLVDIYGRDAAQTFTTNHALNIIFPPKASETQTAKDISDWLGFQTVKGISESKGKEIFTKKRRTESTSDQRRALLLPQEITSLGQTKELVIMENVPPILAERILYYNEKVFVDRLKMISPSLDSLKSAIPTKNQLDSAIKKRELSAFVPKINLEDHDLMIGTKNIQVMQSLPTTSSEKKYIDRPVTPDDIPKLAKKHLEDFSINFSDTEAPLEGVDVNALNKYADELYRQANAEI